MGTAKRTLIGFAIGIGALLVITVILVLTLGGRQPALLDKNTPQGVVQAYLLAIQEKDYQKAYSYLSPEDPKNPNSPFQSYENWLSSIQNSSESTWKANLGEVTVNGDSANVQIMIDIFNPGGPLSNPVRTNPMNFILKYNGTNWLIISPTYLYWLY
jgi:hypothetical protein